MVNIKIILFFATIVNLQMYSQVGINTINPKAMLEISSSNMGILIPRVTLTSKINSAPITNPEGGQLESGTLVYNTAISGTIPNEVEPGYYYWDATNLIWRKLLSDNSLLVNDSWHLNGNSGTTSSSNFIGTIDDIDLVFKRNNIISGIISFNNTAFGVYSQFNNTSGINNTATGFRSLFSNTSGSENTSFGNRTLQENITGYKNTAIGNNALRNNTLGSNNTSVGAFSLFSNTTGSYNLAIGSTCLFTNTTGSFNFANGYNSLYNNTTGSYNVANGSTSLFSNTTGTNNVAYGSISLYNNTTGNNNVANGKSTLYSNLSGGYNVAVGSISLFNNTTGEANTATGGYSLNNNTIGSYNVANGYLALGNLISGSNNIGIGNDAQVPLNSGSNQIRLGNTFITYAGTQVAWSITSDSRLKENIKSSNLGLGFINDLKPVFYLRKDDQSKKVEYGLIAQELEASLNKFGVDTNGIITIDDKGMYSVRYNDLLAPIIKAIQEQQIIINGLKKEIEALKKIK